MIFYKTGILKYKQDDRKDIYGRKIKKIKKIEEKPGCGKRKAECGCNGQEGAPQPLLRARTLP